MDLRGILLRMLRIIFTYAAVGIILFICLCVGSWSAFETSIIHFFTFRRRRNVPVVESGSGTSNDELQSSPESTHTSDDIYSECMSPQTFYDSTETQDTTEQKAENELTRNVENSTKEKFSNLEGLALQMVHLEQHRISIDLPHRTSPREVFESPNDSLPVHMPARKGVLKSSGSETKHLPARGTRRIRFQDPPVYDVSESSSTRSTSSNKSPVGCPLRTERRKISPAPYLKTGLNFQESPAKSSKEKTCITVQCPETLQKENVPVTDLSSETASDQQLSDTETDPLSGKVDCKIPSSFSSKIDDNEPESNESLDHLSKESNSSSSLSSIITNDELAAGTGHSLSAEFDTANLSMLPAKTATNQKECNISVDSLLEELNSTDSTSLLSETDTNQQTANESVHSSAKDSNLTISTTYMEFGESPEVEAPCSEQGRLEYTSKLKPEERSFPEQTSEKNCTQMKELKVEELLYEMALEEKSKSSHKKEEYFNEGDIHDPSEKSKSVNDGQNVQVMDLLSETIICQQSSNEFVNASLNESASSFELNPSVLEMYKEVGISNESQNRIEIVNIESTLVADRKEEMVTQSLNKIEAEILLDDSTEEKDWTLCREEEAYFKTEESKHEVSQVVKTEDDDVLQSEVVTDQQSAEE